MPRLLAEAMCSPETETKAGVKRAPAMRSARSTASSIALMVASRSTTTPLRRPKEGEVPIPTMWTSPSSSTSPAMAQTLVVPISRPATRPFFGTGTTPGTSKVRRPGRALPRPGWARRSGAPKGRLSVAISTRQWLLLLRNRARLDDRLVRQAQVDILQGGALSPDSPEDLGRRRHALPQAPQGTGADL